MPFTDHAENVYSGPPSVIAPGNVNVSPYVHVDAVGAVPCAVVYCKYIVFALHASVPVVYPVLHVHCACNVTSDDVLAGTWVIVLVHVAAFKHQPANVLFARVAVQFAILVAVPAVCVVGHVPVRVPPCILYVIAELLVIHAVFPVFGVYPVLHVHFA